MVDSVFEGPCAGGPKDGHRLKSNVPTIMIPIMRRDGLHAEPYEWHALMRMWIWHGSVWPERRGMLPTKDF